MVYTRWIYLIYILHAFIFIIIFGGDGRGVGGGYGELRIKRPRPKPAFLGLAFLTGSVLIFLDFLLFPALSLFVHKPYKEEKFHPSSWRRAYFPWLLHSDCTEETAWNTSEYKTSEVQSENHKPEIHPQNRTINVFRSNNSELREWRFCQTHNW